MPSQSRLGNGCTAPDSSARVIPNFIPDEIVLDEIPPTEPDAPLLFVGDLSPDKGVQTLLDAYEMLQFCATACARRGVRLTNEPWEISAPVPRWEGPLPHDAVVRLFRSARLVVVPSVWADPCPTVVLEAMAAGRPVVAAASGGILDMVVDGRTGLLVPPGDAPALATALSLVLGDPAPPRLRWAGGTGTRIHRKRLVERIERMYRDAILEAR